MEFEQNMRKKLNNEFIVVRLSRANTTHTFIILQFHTLYATMCTLFNVSNQLNSARYHVLN